MDEQLSALYHLHVAAAFDRGLRLAALVEQKAAGEKWAYDVAGATLAFGKLKFEAPVLGSHASSNNSWLWAWANRHLKLALTNRALGDLVRVTFHRLGLPALAHAGLSLEPLLGADLTKHAADVLGGILARELEYDAHYVTSEPGYRSAILVRDDRLKFTEHYPLHRVRTVFPKVVRARPITDHRAALAAYARDYALTVIEEPGTLKISDGKGELTATFDEHDTLKKLVGVDVSAPPEKKSVRAKPVKAILKPAAKKTTKPKGKATKPAVAKVTVKKPVTKKVAVKPTKAAPKVTKKPAKKR